MFKYNFIPLLRQTPHPPTSVLHSIPGSSLTIHSLLYVYFTAVPCPSTPSKCFSSEREHTIHAGGGEWESSLRTAVLYPVVFLPGLFQFPALSYLEPKSQTSHIYLLCVCLRFLICEIGVIRLKRNIARTITGWRDGNKVVKGLSMPIQLVSLFSYPACTSLFMSQRTSENHQHTINAAQSPLKCKESRIQMFTFSGDSRYLCLTDLTRE